MNGKLAIASLVDSSPTLCLLVVDRTGVVSRANAAMAELLGVALERLPGQPVVALLTEPDGRALADMAQGGCTPPTGPTLLNFVDADDSPRTLSCQVERGDDGFVLLGEIIAHGEYALQKQLLELTNELTVLGREHVKKSRQLEQTLAELDRSYWHLRKIQEVLPICMECKRVKTGDASWENVVDYFRHNAPFLSHGCCPDCAAAVEARLLGPQGSDEAS